MKKLTAILTSLIMTLSVICQTSVFAAFSDVGDEILTKTLLQL